MTVLKDNRSLAWVFVCAGWLYVLSAGYGRLPPPMRLLDLHSGLWAHVSQKLSSTEIPGLKHPVHVAWDKNGVPHFFASEEGDLYRAQGFVMASQRLFQMELVSRQSAGRLSEWVGERTLSMDRFNVMFGMRESAIKTLELYLRDEQVKLMIGSFADGVNACIDQMKQLPPEYIVLGKKPERFDISGVIYMSKALTFNLSGRSFALNLSALQQRIGTEKVLDLFPEFLPDEYEDYIVPEKGSLSKRPPETRDRFAFVSHLKSVPAFPMANPGLGSNNWAVGPAKSASGRTLLANDTHLGYSLPNIWYENQLSAPGFNVYGVSLVAIPGIVAGHNSKVAWATTNGTTNVLDFFEIEFENEISLRYRHGENWLEPAVTEEWIARADGPSEKIQVVKTRLGYLLHREGRYGLVADWMGHRPQGELKALRGLYTASTHQECMGSFEHWAVPIQNFICADAGHVWLRHNGRVPRREVGEGRFIMDGTRAEVTLDKSIAGAELPEVKDAPYVLSANQKALGPRSPLYLGWDYEEPYRGKMIRRRLTAKEKLTPEDFMAMQNDAHDLQAEYVLPLLLKAVNTEKLTSTQRDWVERLRRWDFGARAAAAEPSLYRAWFSAFKQTVFDDDFDQTPGKPFYPKSLRFALMLKRLSEDPSGPDAQWVKGGLSATVTDAFDRAWRRLEADYGPSPEGWLWRRYNRVAIPHVARLPGFGSEELAMDGSGESIRGNRGNHGPVYKAVFELDQEMLRTWIQVPGGNEGDPFSPEYGRFVKDWSEGKMREAEYYKDWNEAKTKAVRVIEFRPKAG